MLIKHMVSHRNLAASRPDEPRFAQFLLMVSNRKLLRFFYPFRGLFPEYNEVNEIIVNFIEVLLRMS